MSLGSLTARVNTDRLMPWLGGVAALLMLALMAWLGANIFWTLSAPESIRPSAPIETDLQRTLPALTERHLFGVYLVASPVSAPSNIRLNGVIAAQRPGHRAYAMLVVEGKPAQLVREGEEIAPGITLQRVMARQVEILRGGQTQTLALPESAKPLIEANKGVPEISPPAVESSKAPVIMPPAVEPSKAAVSTPPLPSRRKFRRNSDDDT
ncbi:MAG: hypothetical protein NT159_19150 [Proteobacteria bacterium]|nr:hypothetical protein [Pseudomonadota bacterium]